MERLLRYDLYVDYDYDDDGEKNHYIADYMNNNGSWVQDEEVTKLEQHCEDLTKRIVELELENMILRNSNKG